MMIDIKDVKCKWINLDRDTERNEQMEELVARVGIKDAERVSAIEGIEPHEGVRYGEEHYRSCAESHFKVLEEYKEDFPLLVFEDDVEYEEGVSTAIEVPNSTDALYIGTSHGDQKYITEEVQGYPHLWKISKVFAAHAIVYFNSKYTDEIQSLGRAYIHQKNTPFDVGVAYELQGKYNVYALKDPMFYQADSKNHKNQWEMMTRTPLRYQPHQSFTQTIRGNIGL